MSNPIFGIFIINPTFCTYFLSTFQHKNRPTLMAVLKCPSPNLTYISERFLLYVSILAGIDKMLARDYREMKYC